MPLIPPAGSVTLTVSGKEVHLTNLDKLFWPERRITKGELIQYYADVAPLLLPHIADRAMVMKRYPHGAAGEFFFMKRAPTPRPDWIRTCRISHDSGNVIDFPVIDDLPSLLWVINLGCIDLNQWYAKCDDVDRPDYLHFDLDPGTRDVGAGARCGAHRAGRAGDAEDARLRQDDRLAKASTSTCRSCADHCRRTSGRSRRRWPRSWPGRHPKLLTSEYRVAKRPEGPRARRLQPERLGPDAGLGLFRATDTVCRRLDAGDLAGDRQRRARSRTFASTTYARD